MALSLLAFSSTFPFFLLQCWWGLSFLNGDSHYCNLLSDFFILIICRLRNTSSVAWMQCDSKYLISGVSPNSLNKFSGTFACTTMEATTERNETPYTCGWTWRMKRSLLLFMTCFDRSLVSCSPQKTWTASGDSTVKWSSFISASHYGKDKYMHTEDWIYGGKSVDCC